MKKRNIDVTVRDFAPIADGKTDGNLFQDETGEKARIWYRRRKLALEQLAKLIEKGKAK